MVILSHRDLNELADSILHDFYRGAPLQLGSVNIDQLASDYLGLKVCYEKLSEDGSILGLTSYAECYLELSSKRDSPIRLEPDTILLDKSFSERAPSSLEGRRRFTLAHECAHQILYRYESSLIQKTVRQAYSLRRSYSLRELKSREDWNEWQADALGAALLMPKNLTELIFFRCSAAEPLVQYRTGFSPTDRAVIKNMKNILGVSQTALIIRLKQLGLLQEKSADDYIDPLDVVA